MIFQADFKTRVLMESMWGKCFSRVPWGKCANLGGFLQCPPSSVKTQACGNVRSTKVNISYRLEFLDARQYADVTLLLCSKPVTYSLPWVRTRVLPSGVSEGRRTCAFNSVRLSQTGLHTSICLGSDCKWGWSAKKLTASFIEGLVPWTLTAWYVNLCGWVACGRRTMLEYTSLDESLVGSTD